MHYVYLLRSIGHPEQTYVGLADDLRARVAAHNAGQALHTKKFRPWRLVTYVAFSDQAKAVAFERYEDRLRARLRQEASVLGPQGEGGPQ